MLLSVHPPLLIAPAGREPGAVELRCLLHASLWLSVTLDEWGVRRQGHLQLVRDADGGEWREVDLARHPLRRAAAARGRLESVQLEDEIRRVLAGRSLQLFRIAALGLVSEIGEGREDFRRRATGLLRPEVERRLAAIADRPLPRLPWRRRSAEHRRVEEKAALAAELAGLADAVESIELADLTRHVRRAEAGELLVAAGVLLAPPRHRTLML